MNSENSNLQNQEPLYDRQWYLKRFHWLRDEHSDELPVEDVRKAFPFGHPRCNTFKCQGNFIAGLKADLESALLDKIFDDTVLIGKIKAFIARKSSSFEGKFTTADEISKINEILNEVIHSLEKTG